MRQEATLISRVCLDGTPGVKDSIALGKKFYIDTRTITSGHDCATKGEPRVIVMAFCCPECVNGEWMPVELLAMEPVQ